jgi:pimeloyl-ACP methyl ester carboxylesterase
MSVLLYLAAFLAVAVGIAHSILGERYILVRLFRRSDLPKLFGGPEFTARTLRFAWHITSVAWWGFAALMILLAGGTLSPANLSAILAATFLLTGFITLAISRGQHLAWIVFLFIGGACLNAAIGAVTIEKQSAEIAYGSNRSAGSTFLFNGNRFYYETYGSGPPLLLIHGNGQSIGSFKEQIGPLSRGHKVIAMDSRGQGKSELGTAALTYEQMAEDSNALLDDLKLDHVKILGWSDGGIIGLLLAIHHPEKVSMLAVMGANLEPDGAYPWAVDGIVRLRTRIVAELARTDNPKPLQLQLQFLDLLGNQPHIPLVDLNKIQAPTLVMAADRDVIRGEHTLSMFHAIPKSQLAIFPGATHLIPAQDPERFNRTVLDFFDKPFSMPDTKDLGWFD